MAIATIATVSVPPESIVQAPLPTGSVFGHWNFDFVDAAGTAGVTQIGDGVDITSAVFSVASAAAGVATFTVTAVDSKGLPLSTSSTTATLPFTLPATTFPSATGVTVMFS